MAEIIAEWEEFCRSDPSLRSEEGGAGALLFLSTEIDLYKSDPQRWWAAREALEADCVVLEEQMRPNRSSRILRAGYGMTTEQYEAFAEDCRRDGIGW